MDLIKKLKDLLLSLTETKLFKTIKKPKNLITVLVIWSLIFYFFIYKTSDYFNPNLKDYRLYLFLLLSFLTALHIFCFFYTIKTIIKLKRGKGFANIISIIISLLTLPFVKLCFLGVCGLLVPGFILNIIPFFLIGFVIEYITIILIILILINLLFLRMMGCLKREKLEFKVKFNLPKQ